MNDEPHRPHCLDLIVPTRRFGWVQGVCRCEWRSAPVPRASFVHELFAGHVDGVEQPDLAGLVRRR